jgi:hypothetical protein
MRTSLSNKAESIWRIASHPAFLKDSFQAKLRVRKMHNGIQKFKE